MSVITSFLFLGFGILFGSLCSERSVGGVASIVISGQSLLSGMWFPVEDMDGLFIKIMNLLPFKNATILVQNTLNGFSDISNDFIKPLIIVLLYSFIIFLLSIIVFKNKMKTK